MGYLTENLVSQSPVFRSKIEMALTKLVDDTLTSTTPKNVEMAKVVMQDIPRHAKDLATLLALAGMDLDSTDTQIDSGVAANIDWLVARTSK